MTFFGWPGPTEALGKPGNGIVIFCLKVNGKGWRQRRNSGESNTTKVLTASEERRFLKDHTFQSGLKFHDSNSLRWQCRKNCGRASYESAESS